MNNYDTIILKSTTGTGKTTAVAELCKNLNNNGVGLRNKYNSSSSERIYNPGQQTREMVGKDNVKYAKNEPHAGSPGIRCETFVPYRYN